MVQLDQQTNRVQQLNTPVCSLGHTLFVPSGRFVYVVFFFVIFFFFTDHMFVSDVLHGVWGTKDKTKFC